MSLYELMELGGWKSYEMVLRYAHLVPAHLSYGLQMSEKPQKSIQDNLLEDLIKARSLLIDRRYKTVCMNHFWVYAIYDADEGKASKDVLKSYADLKKETGNEHSAAHSFSGMALLDDVAAVEVFLVDLATIAYLKHPEKLSKKTIMLDDVLEFSKEEILKREIAKSLNSLLYEGPLKLREKYWQIISAPDDLLIDEWQRYVEIRARRDLGVHNNWQKNDIYIRKLTDAGIDIPSEMDLIPDGEYYTEAVDVLSKITDQLYVHMDEKFFGSQLKK